MQIAFHIGANCTDNDRLIRSVLRNTDVLWRQGIAVPGPGRYRSLIREAMQALGGSAPAPGTRDILMDAIAEADGLTRLVLSNDNFICVPGRIFEHGVFYAQAETKVRALHALFAGDDIALFMGIRHPAAFLQDALACVGQTDPAAYLGLMHPLDIRWSDVVQRIRHAAPDTPLTIWCNEDTPVLWDRLIRAFCGASADIPLVGGTDLLADLLTADGMARLDAAYAARPDASAADRLDIIAEIWTDHAQPDAIEDVIDLPGLDADMIARIGAQYDADLDRIAAIPGVTLLRA